MKLFGNLRELVAAVFRKDTKEIELRPNSSSYSGVTSPVVELPPPSSGTVELVDKTSSQTLSGKSISGSTNTLSDIPNNATTADSADTASAIVARDGSGNFSAGTITADLAGNASTATSATSATSFTGSLSGEVTGTQSATVVADDVIDNANIKSTAAIAYSKLALTGSIVNNDLAGSIDAVKIGAGSVDNTEFGYLNGVTSSIQTQFGGKAASGANSDITSLTGLTTALSIPQGGTGQDTANAALNALLPAQGSSVGKYLKTDGSNTSWASASGGAGEINAVLNSSGADGTTDWVADTSFSVTVSTATTIPLYPAITTALQMSSSAAISIGAQTQNSGVYYGFTMPPALRNRKLKLEFYFNSPVAADGTWGVAVYNGSTRVALSTDSAGDTILPAGVTGGKFVAYIDTDAGVTYRVNFVQRTSTTTTNLVVSNVVIGPGIQPQGAVVGELQSYTPTTAGLGTLAASQFLWRRVGDSIQISGRGTTGSSISNAQVQLGLPSGLTVSSRYASTALVGKFSENAVNASTYDFNILATANNTYLTLGEMSANSGLTPISSGTGATFIPANQPFSFFAELAIAEWAGSGTVQLAQNDVEYLSNSDVSTSVSNTSAFAYGPAGQSIVAVSSTGAWVRKRVQVQAGSWSGKGTPAIKVSSDGVLWLDAKDVFPANQISGKFYGIDIQPVSGSTTAVDIAFGGDGATSTQAWSAFTSYKWRVDVAAPGQAVGFGIVSPGVSAGLVSASGLPGNTTGNAIASGYVGETITATQVSAVSAVSAGIAKVAELQLTDGVWGIYGYVTFGRNEATVSDANLSPWINHIAASSTSYGYTLNDCNDALSTSYTTVQVPVHYFVLRVSGNTATLPDGTTWTLTNKIIYLNAFHGSFSTATPQLSGRISATRIA